MLFSGLAGTVLLAWLWLRAGHSPPRVLIDGFLVGLFVCLCSYSLLGDDAQLLIHGAVESFSTLTLKLCGAVR